MSLLGPSCGETHVSAHYTNAYPCTCTHTHFAYWMPLAQPSPQQRQKHSRGRMLLTQIASRSLAPVWLDLFTSHHSGFSAVQEAKASLLLHTAQHSPHINPIVQQEHSREEGRTIFGKSWLPRWYPSSFPTSLWSWHPIPHLGNTGQDHFYMEHKENGVQKVKGAWISTPTSDQMNYRNTPDLVNILSTRP